METERAPPLPDFVGSSTIGRPTCCLSRQLTRDLAWRNVRQRFIDGGLPGSVADLKTTDGKDMVLHGGVRLAQDMQSGLIDEHGLVVAPVALGECHPLIAPVHPGRGCRFGRAQPFPFDALLAGYAPHRRAPRRSRRSTARVRRA
jgi:hypothetical protein